MKLRVTHRVTRHPVGRRVDHPPTDHVRPEAARHRAAIHLPVVAALGLSALVLSSCGDDAVAERGGDGEVVDVEMTDYSFGGLPAEIAAGTRLQVSNGSPGELHELVAIRLPDGDDRRVDEIVDDGLGAVVEAAPPAAVLLAAPGGDQIAAVGDGVLAEPGRYLVLCAVPTGADPQEYLAAAATSDGPPAVDGGPPHFVNGMVAELIVTDG